MHEQIVQARYSAQSPCRTSGEGGVRDICANTYADARKRKRTHTHAPFPTTLCPASPRELHASSTGKGELASAEAEDGGSKSSCAVDKGPGNAAHVSWGFDMRTPHHSPPFCNTRFYAELGWAYAARTSKEKRCDSLDASLVSLTLLRAPLFLATPPTGRGRQISLL
ncbi:hypothetical protein HDV57DRAFT_487211 [Trichoderma longibrachiatum]